MTITLTDADAQRDYHVTVRYTCRPALSENPREVAVDVDEVRLDSAVVWLNDMGCEVDFADGDGHKRRELWAGQIERDFGEEIVAACIADFTKQKYEAA